MNECGPAGIEAFCNQNDGEGWMLPETLRLTDCVLDHDDRANEHQPAASRLHVRDLLDEADYRQLTEEIERVDEEPPGTGEVSATSRRPRPRTGIGILKAGCSNENATNYSIASARSIP